MAETLQSPIILPPEAVSKSLITSEAFALSQSFAVTLQLHSENVKVTTTETEYEIENADGTTSTEIVTSVVTEPDNDKELAFSIFLTDAEDAYTFGASAGRCGWTDYSTKGEVSEGIAMADGEKLSVNYGNNQNIDLLLDHAYTENEQFLVKNQTPGIKSVFSMLFINKKEFFNEVKDAYGNAYYDKLLDSNGNVTDFLTGESKSIQEYQSPVIIQHKTNSGTDSYTVFDFIFDGEPVNIVNMNYLTFRLLFENHGGIITLEIMRPGETFYRRCMSKELGYNFYGNKNLRFGFGQFTPILSYDKDKVANFSCHNIQLQRGDERPNWLKTLDKELSKLLGDIKFDTEYLA